MEKSYLMKAPFGIQTQRFASIGYHPSLDPEGIMTAIQRPLGPGCYDAKPVQCLKSSDRKSPWTVKVLSEEFSQNLGFKNATVLEYRREMSRKGGPGVYDVPESLYHQQSNIVVENVNFSKDERFRTWKNNLPGPGTYEQKPQSKRMTKLPTFEFDGCQERFKSLDKPWWRPSNLYHPVDRDSMDARLAKLVSIRGPYELFTGPRDASTIKNHFTPPQVCSPDKYYEWLDGIDKLLRHTSNKQKGKFFGAKRFLRKPTERMMIGDPSTCYRDPNLPGPAHYGIDYYSIKPAPSTRFAFNDSKLVARPGVKWLIMPGPGRYKIQKVRCTRTKNKTSVFLSKTGRTVYKAPDYAAF